MFHIFRRVLREYRYWDAYLRFALALALILLLADVVLFFLVPPENRIPLLIGGFALIIVIQLTIMGGFHSMTTAMSAAQRSYMQEDYERAAELIEPLARKGSADARMLALLGNAYRQMGRLDESKAVLYEALNKSPDQHYVLYGIGRTLLSEGNYTMAVDMFQRALSAGAPHAVLLDLAEAQYRAGDMRAAADALAGIGDLDLYGESPRELMAAYLREQVGQSDAGFNAELLQAGLPYWETAAARFAATPYGRDLALDIQQMRGSEIQ